MLKKINITILFSDTFDPNYQSKTVLSGKNQI